MKLKTSRSILGGYTSGSLWIRNSPVQNSNLAATDGMTSAIALLLNALTRIVIYRRILLFPTGNSNAPPNESVSIYLDYADPKTSADWHACAQFALVMSNVQDPSIYVVSRTCLVIKRGGSILTS